MKECKMEKTSVFLVLFLQGLWATESMLVTGEIGKKIKIKCSHSYASTNVKYFCKGACYHEDILITSRDKNNDGKYSIRDEGNTFYVTIKDLTAADSGQYWCGIERAGVDTYDSVKITVVKNSDDSEDKLFSSEKLLYVGVSLAVLGLALAIVLLIYLRYQNRNMDKFQTDFQKKEAHHDITTVSANKEQESDREINTVDFSPSDKNRGFEDDTHRNDPSESPDQTGNVTYSTVTFNSKRTVTHHTPDTTYSAIKHTSTDGATIYSNL